MTQTSKVYWLDDEPMFTMFEDDGAYHLIWHCPPEPVVHMAVTNPNQDCCRDDTGKTWNGATLLGFIQYCPPSNRHYQHIVKS